STAATTGDVVSALARCVSIPDLLCAAVPTPAFLSLRKGRSPPRRGAPLRWRSGLPPLAHKGLIFLEIISYNGGDQHSQRNLLAVLGFIRGRVSFQVRMEVGIEPARHRHGFHRDTWHTDIHGCPPSAWG